jgi:hypothetical protein
MTEIVIAFDTLASAALATVCGWAVMSPRVRDGVIIKLGMIAMSLGLALISFALTDPYIPDLGSAVAVAGTLVLAGMLIVVCGAALRVMRRPKHRRRVTDWADLSDSGFAR